MEVTTQHTEIEKLLEKVTDPEIPVLSITEMGIIRQIELVEKTVVVTITPTYSGCPAMDTIAKDIESILEDAGYEVSVKTVLSPAWTTDWITETGRKKLEAYGIAPPSDPVADKKALLGEKNIVKCPQCKSRNTSIVSPFGSTPCKALFRCSDCGEPFDYFKCLI